MGRRASKVSFMVWEIDSWVSKRVPSKSKMTRVVMVAVMRSVGIGAIECNWE